ncbi:hypothetical protein ACETU7_30340 [Rhodococcus sp. 3Y1]
MSAEICELVRQWDDQQAAYIADREKRFDVILDVLELQHAHTPFTVVDLACGPGSLSARILESSSMRALWGSTTTRCCWSSPASRRRVSVTDCS